MSVLSILSWTGYKRQVEPLVTVSWIPCHQDDQIYDAYRHADFCASILLLAVNMRVFYPEIFEMCPLCYLIP